MGKLTLYLDDETAAKLKAAAKAAGTSQSQWVAGLIRERTASVWPASIEGLLGAWKDLPTAEELREGGAVDAAREPIGCTPILYR